MPRGHSSALRTGRWSEPGRAYFITFTTFGRRRLFVDWSIAHAASRCLGLPATWGDARILGWVLMPDHFHGLVSLGTQLDLSRTVARAKALASRDLRQSAGLERPVWAQGFHDRAVRSTDDVRAAARYLVANPLRAGLVEAVGDYPYWNAVWLSDDTPV